MRIFVWEFPEADLKKFSLDELISIGLTNSYNNEDDYDEFFYEYWNALAYSNAGVVFFLKGCTIMDMGIDTTFALYRYESRDNNYFHVTAGGEFPDILDIEGHYEKRDKKDDYEDIIKKFIEECSIAHVLDGELTQGELDDAGSYVQFYDEE